jgi:hypothetical protein
LNAAPWKNLLSRLPVDNFIGLVRTSAWLSVAGSDQNLELNHPIFRPKHPSNWPATFSNQKSCFDAIRTGEYSFPYQ